MYRLIAWYIVMQCFFVASADDFGIALNNKINIAVLDFDPKGINADESFILTDKLRSEFVNNPKYVVIERNKMDYILKEQGFQQSGCTDEDCVIKAGQVLGVKKMIAGSIGRLGTIFTVSARIIDLQKGVIEKSTEVMVQGAIENVLLQGIPELYKKLINDTSEKVGSVALQDSVNSSLKVEYRKGWPAGYTLDNSQYVKLFDEDITWKNYPYYVNKPVRNDLIFENIKQFESLFNIDKNAVIEINSAHEIINQRDKSKLYYPEIVLLAVTGICYSFNPKARYKDMYGFTHPLLYVSSAVAVWGTLEMTFGYHKAMKKAQKKIMHAVELYNQSRR